MTTKHTSGPWFVNPEADDIGFYVTSRDRPFICDVHNGAHDEITEANAHLIAAAPELLEQLMQANAQMELALSCVIAKRYDEAELHLASLNRPRRDAIAKALGEAT